MLTISLSQRRTITTEVTVLGTTEETSEAVDNTTEIANAAAIHAKCSYSRSGVNSCDLKYTISDPAPLPNTASLEAKNAMYSQAITDSSLVSIIWSIRLHMQTMKTPVTS